MRAPLRLVRVERCGRVSDAGLSALLRTLDGLEALQLQWLTINGTCLGCLDAPATLTRLSLKGSQQPCFALPPSLKLVGPPIKIIRGDPYDFWICTRAPGTKSWLRPCLHRSGTLHLTSGLLPGCAAVAASFIVKAVSRHRQLERLNLAGARTLSCEELGAIAAALGNGLAHLNLSECLQLRQEGLLALSAHCGRLKVGRDETVPLQGALLP